MRYDSLKNISKQKRRIRNNKIKFAPPEKRKIKT